MALPDWKLKLFSLYFCF